MHMGRKLTVLWDERELCNSVNAFTCFCCCCASQCALPTQCPIGHFVFKSSYLLSNVASLLLSSFCFQNFIDLITTLIKMITNSNSQDSSGLLTKDLLSYCRIAQIEILLIIGYFEPAALNYYFQQATDQKLFEYC